MNLQDASGVALNGQRFQMLEDIAKDLAGEVCFPTCFDVAMRVRNILRDPEVSLDQVVSVVKLEPLLTARLLQLSNSVAYNPTGTKIAEIKVALLRVGLNLAKTTAIGLAMNQLLRSKELAEFGTLANLLWEHTLETAATASVLARNFLKISPDQAFLAGLMHDLGAFYMLYRASQYPELKARPDTMLYVIVQWHESIGESLAYSLGLPENIIEAIRDHDHPRPPVFHPKNLTDVLYVANILSGAVFEWQRKDMDEPEVLRPELNHPAYTELFEEIALVKAEIMTALK